MKPPRNTPPKTRNQLVNDLRDIAPIPATYKSYKLVDGKMVFMGEFPTPVIGDKAQNQIDFKRV